MNPAAHFLAELAKVQGDTRAQAALVAEFTLRMQPDAVRESLAVALDAAAVLHWFDDDLLANVMGVDIAASKHTLAALIKLPFVEPYPGNARYNLHEATRLGWRTKLAAERIERFRALSARAAQLFATKAEPTAEIEWIYHLLCGDPENGATALEQLNRKWSGRAHPEHEYALARALNELVECRLVTDRVWLWSQLTIASTRQLRGEVAQLAAIEHTLIETARTLVDGPAEAEAQNLLGNTLEAEGKLDDALAAYSEYLAITRRLAEQDPSNAGWLRELAVAHSCMGGVFQAQGKLDDALAAYSDSLAITRRLAEQDPSNVGLRHESLVALVSMARCQSALGNPDDAFANYEAGSALLTALLDIDPDRPLWLEEMQIVGKELQDLQNRLNDSP
jgi:tetratricopeptide (TPR) repeat protein